MVGVKLDLDLNCTGLNNDMEENVPALISEKGGLNYWTSLAQTMVILFEQNRIINKN